MDLLTVVFLPLTVCILLSHVVTMVAILACRMCRGQFVYILIVNMSLADCVMAVFLLLNIAIPDGMLYVLTCIFGNEAKDDWRLIAQYQMYTPIAVLYQVHFITMFVIALDRFMAICRPFTYRVMSSKVSSKWPARMAIVVGIWLTSTVIYTTVMLLDNAFPATVNQTLADEECCQGAMSDAPRSYQALVQYFQRMRMSTFVIGHSFCWGLFLASAVLYLQVFRAIQKSDAFPARVGPIVNGQTKQMATKTRNRRELATALVFVFLVFATGYMAIMFIQLCAFGLPSRQQRTYYLNVQPVDLVAFTFYVWCTVVTASSVCNLFFYVWRIRTFRKCVSSLLRFRCPTPPPSNS